LVKVWAAEGELCDQGQASSREKRNPLSNGRGSVPAIASGFFFALGLSSIFTHPAPRWNLYDGFFISLWSWDQ
jgi:hypothetical protein